MVITSLKIELLIEFYILDLGFPTFGVYLRFTLSYLEIYEIVIFGVFCVLRLLYLENIFVIAIYGEF